MKRPIRGRVRVNNQTNVIRVKYCRGRFDKNDGFCASHRAMEPWMSWQDGWVAAAHPLWDGNPEGHKEEEGGKKKCLQALFFKASDQSLIQSGWILQRQSGWMDLRSKLNKSLSTLQHIYLFPTQYGSKELRVLQPAICKCPPPFFPLSSCSDSLLDPFVDDEWW